MTHEQKPESAEFRTREAQIRELCASCSYEEVATAHILEAEARGAAEQEAQGIEEAKDEGANYVLTSLALLFGRDGFEIRDGSETWEGDVNATLEGILKAGGLVDDEGDLLDLAALKDRLAEQRRRDAEGAEPVGRVTGHWADGTPMFDGWDTAKPLALGAFVYDRPANVAVLEKALNDIGNEVLEGAEPFLDAVIRILKTVGIDPLNGSEPMDQVADLEDRVKELEGENKAWSAAAANALTWLENGRQANARDELKAAQRRAVAIREGGEHG